MVTLLLAMITVGFALVLVTAAKKALTPKPEPVRRDSHECKPCCHPCPREGD